MSSFASIVKSPDFQKQALSGTLRFFLIFMIIKFAFQGFSFEKFKEEIYEDPAQYLVFSVIFSVIYGCVTAYIKIKKQDNE